MHILVLHDAYSFAPAFAEELVQKVLVRLSPDDRSTILDPFCGTGTTLLESKLRGLKSIGVDSNPVCVLVSKAKTNWALRPGTTLELAHSIVASARGEHTRFISRYEKDKATGHRWTPESDPIFTRSPSGRYLMSSGLIRRGWIGARPALKTLLIAEQLWGLAEAPRNFLFLCLLGLLVPTISNMSYGPEIYKARARRDCDVFGLFERRVVENLQKLSALKAIGSNAPTRVVLADSVNGGLHFLRSGSIDFVLTSPPYLSDHDYTRMTRLELVFSGYVTSPNELRQLKKRLLRSSSKNVYKADQAAREVEEFASVRTAIESVAERASQHQSGFARVYPKLIGEYFGGMYKHFKELTRTMRSGGRAVYIVSDQSSFFAVPIPSAAIVAELAHRADPKLRVLSQEAVKRYRGTRGAVSWSNQEWLLLLGKK